MDDLISPELIKEIGAKLNLDEQSLGNSDALTKPSLDLDPGFCIFSKLEEDFNNGSFSWIGRFEDFALCYLSFASILHAETDSNILPVGSFVIGKTSTGKTEFLESVARLFPEDRVLNLTSSSSKALYYECRFDPEYLNGKVVFVEELAALKDPELQYLLRVLLTKGFATHTTVINGESEKIEIRAEISLQSTGLDMDHLREDTMNRLILFNSNDSEAMTKRVVESVASRYEKKDMESNRSTLSFFQGFFESLRPMDVVIPYARKIKFDTSSHVTRRASKQFFDLLATVTLLNQHKRLFDYERGVLVSEWEDFETLKRFSNSQEPQETNVKLSPSQESLLEVFREHSSSELTYQELFETTDERFELSTIKKSVKRLIELGKIEQVHNGRPAKFRLKSSAHNRFAIL